MLRDVGCISLDLKRIAAEAIRQRQRHAFGRGPQSEAWLERALEAIAAMEAPAVSSREEAIRIGFNMVIKAERVAGAARQIRKAQ